jgi:hypothetical protein
MRIFTFQRLLCLSLLAGAGHAATPFAQWTGAELTLNNQVVQRRIKLPAPSGSFLTTSYAPIAGAFPFFQPNSPDFQFEAGGVAYSGAGKWTLVGVSRITDTR